MGKTDEKGIPASSQTIRIDDPDFVVLKKEDHLRLIKKKDSQINAL